MGEEVLVELLLIFILLGVAGMVLTKRQRTGAGTRPQAHVEVKDPAAQNTASEAKRRAANPDQIVEDARMTQTSRIVDAIQILDDLGAASPGYRHYCELIGQSQATGGVTAPYCQRQVAYYDLRCYRIEVRGGKDVETLVAHERSIDPFYFRDSSSDDRVYVDLDSFGSHCILVNATNRVEGPNSDFAKKFSSVVGAAQQPAATGIPGAMAAVRTAPKRAANVVLGSIRASLGAALTSVYGGMQPALAGAGAPAGAGSPAGGLRAHTAAPSNWQFAGRPANPGAPSARGGGSRPSNTARPQQRPPQHHTSGYYGRPGGQGFPGDLNSFLGGALNSGYLGGPYYHKNDTSAAIEALVGMGLGAIVGSIANSQKPHTSSNPYPTSSPYATSRPDPTNVNEINAFRGYRIIEDVVPLNSPIYALGEIYRNGPDVFIGRSVSSSYPSSYFATKPEAEVIAALS